ncbi:MAG: ABC transporter permease [Caldiserica bacterium]|jgi:simple sugar transport system permease protein|nr:ABC transporter permease [Caldisericota bacterium]
MSDIPLIKQTISIMTPLLLAATGGLFSALAGVLNIALEGLMLNSAFFSILFSVFTGNIFLGLLLGIISTLILTLIFGFIGLYLRANIFISGLATNLLAGSLSIVLSQQIFGQTGSVTFPNMPRLPTIDIPVLNSIPVLGNILSGHNILVYISWFVLILASVVIYRTPFGIRLRATGVDFEAAKSLGLEPRRMQLFSLLISGFTCGLAGGFLSLSLGAFVPNVSSGRGWIALVIIYLGNQKPVGLLIGSVIFGFVEYLSNFLQATSNIPSGLLLGMPFFVTVLAMIFYSLFEKGLRTKFALKKVPAVVPDDESSKNILDEGKEEK